MKEIQEAIEFLKNKGIDKPEIGFVLGTGMGNLKNEINITCSIDYADIPYFPLSTVESHHGKLIYGEIRGKKVIAMLGRFHYYEGYTMQQITFPIRVMKLLGIKCLFLSNAAGAVNLNFKKGSLMLIDDHINLLPENPLRGKNIDELGKRFPDMSQPYSQFLNNKMLDIAEKENILLNKGVYAAVTGPNLETKAEYRYLRMIGADAVGMSTVPEVIVCNHMNLPCAAISVITDECDPDNLLPVDIKEILAVAATAETKLNKLFVKLVEEL